MDYRELLIKYIEYVGDYEGSTFLPPREGYSGLPKFTDEEKAELTILEAVSYLGPRTD